MFHSMPALGRAGARSGMALGMMLLVAASGAAELTGYGAFDLRAFPRAPADFRQEHSAWSVVLQPELYISWDEGAQSLLFVPFARWDAHDGSRSHWDIRELFWEGVGETWDLRAGIAKVFWGVAESQHLVDIVNQTDLVEDPDTEDKLGQPMLNLSLMRDWGTLDLFVLPGFRERTFPGLEGRLRSMPRVDTERTVFESGRGRGHVDYALRWSQVLGVFDIGVSYFYGTSRDPRLDRSVDSAGEAILVPHYDLISQVGLDLQATTGSMAWKLEAIRRSGAGSPLVASTAGFEYTFVGVVGSTADLGLLGEYHFDSEGTGNTMHFADDIFAGLRLTLNDAPSTEMLAGVLVNRGNGARIFNLEASRRLGEDWRLELIARAWRGFPADSPLDALRRDDYVQLSIQKYF